MEDGLIFATPEECEVEFRTGRRIVPPHLIPFFMRLETHRMSYEEAVVAANRLMESDFVNAQGDSVIAAHFKGFR